MTWCENDLFCMAEIEQRFFLALLLGRGFDSMTPVKSDLGLAPAEARTQALLESLGRYQGVRCHDCDKIVV